MELTPQDKKDVQALVDMVLGDYVVTLIEHYDLNEPEDEEMAKEMARSMTRICYKLAREAGLDPVKYDIDKVAQALEIQP